MRAFISIDLLDNLKKEIAKIQDKLPEFEGKKTEIENLHLTLKFLGWITDEKAGKIRKILKKIKYPSFETEINSIGMFDDRIIWLNIPGCEQLQKKIDEKLFPLFEKETRFMGHLTIGRIKHLQDRKKFREKIAKIKFKPLKFRIEQFRLKKSTLKRSGPIYEDIEIYNLN